MPEPDPGSSLRTVRSMVEHLRREYSRQRIIVACLDRAATALDFAIKAEREGPQVERRESSKGGFPRT